MQKTIIYETETGNIIGLTELGACLAGLNRNYSLATAETAGTETNISQLSITPVPVYEPADVLEAAVAATEDFATWKAAQAALDAVRSGNASTYKTEAKQAKIDAAT